MSAWFKGWFNSAYYPLLYSHRDDKEAEFLLDNLVELIHPVKNSRILDIGCGRGRHSVYLNRKGFKVTGIDISDTCIEECKAYENDSLSFYVHDMRQLFRTNYFDITLSLFTSFGYFANKNDNLRIIKNASLSIKKGGTFVLDYINPNYTINNLINSEVLIKNGVKFDINRKFEDGMIVKMINIEDAGKTHSFKEMVNAYELEDFKKLFNSANLKLESVYGNYELDSFDPQNSPRMIMLCTR